MRQYTIAGHTIKISGKRLDTLPGFNFFLSNKRDNKPLLAINTEAALQDSPISSFFTSKLGGANCDFSTVGNSYHFRIKEDENYLLTKIDPEVNSFYAKMQLTGLCKDSWLYIACKLLFGIAALPCQTVSIHSSAVMIHGKSILFLGESGTGKSTQTGLWLNHLPNTELLNDDSPFIRVETDGNIRVYGSPWSGKTPCYKNISTPIVAFVRLSQAPYNRIRRLKGAEAIGALLPSFPFSLFHEKKLAESIYSIVSQTLRQTPVYHLECLPDAGAVELVYSTLIQDRFL